MKKTIKVISLAFALFLVSGCFNNGSNNSVEPSNETSESQNDESQSNSQGQSSASRSNGGWSFSWSQGGSNSARSSESSVSKSYESIPAPEAGKFAFNDDELNTPQEIHTSSQKAYLNYSGEYYTITSSALSGFGANGTSNQSTPNKVTVRWNFTAPSGKTVSSYTLVFGQKSDLSDGLEVQGTSAQQVSFYNAYLGTNYFKVIAKLNDNSTVESSIKTFKVTTQGPRNLYVGNLPNCRDTGGRTTYAGGKIKQGLIYRTSGNKFDNRTAPDSEANNILKNQLKVKTEINVADNTGYNISVSGTTVKTAFMDYGKSPYSNMSRNSQRIRQVFEILGNESNYPVYYHCRIGTDRTGIVGICLGGLLGIPFNEVMQDYAFSNFAPIDGQRYPNKYAAADTESASQDGNGDDPAKYIAEILAMPGKNFQEQTYYSLLSLGVPSTTLDKVIDIMTEGNKATITPYTLATANDMTLDGGATKKTGGSDYKDPATYVQISNGKSVSYKTNFAAGEADVVAFLGCTNKSSSTKLAAGIDLKIDGVSQTIIDRNYWRCGFGTTQRTGCTGYMFIKLGKYNLTAGEHTITIAGKNSDTFNVGTISVYGATSTGGNGGNGGQQQDKYEFAIADAIEGSKNPGSNPGVKHDKNASTTWNVSNVPAGNYKLLLKCQMTSSSHSGIHWFNEAKYNQAHPDNPITLPSNSPDTINEADYRYSFDLDGTTINISNAKTYGENKMSNTAMVEVEMNSVTVSANASKLKITRLNIGYSVYISGIALEKIA